MKYSNLVKNSILKEYLEGASIQALSHKFHVPVKTIESWGNRSKWSQKRKHESQRAFETVFDEFRAHIESASKDALGAIAIISQIAREEIEHLAKMHPKSPRGEEFRLQA